MNIPTPLHDLWHSHEGASTRGPQQLQVDPTSPQTSRPSSPAGQTSALPKKQSYLQHQLVVQAQALAPWLPAAMLQGLRLGLLAAMPPGSLGVLVVPAAMPQGRRLPEVGCAPVLLAAHPGGRPHVRQTRRLARPRLPTGPVSMSRRHCELYAATTTEHV